jgi:hypothetical protein
MNVERKIAWVKVPSVTHVQDQLDESLIGISNKTDRIEVTSAQGNVRPVGLRSHRQLQCKTGGVEVPSASTKKL